jgi:hypothetical protein
MKTKHHYVREWNRGLAIYGNGRPACLVHRFDDRNQADAYVDDYRPPNHCPDAYAERVARKSIESLLPSVNQWGDPSDYWLASDCGTYETI